MAKQSVEPLAYWPQTVEALCSGGALLVSRDAQGRPNPMTIGWALGGIVWGKPIVAVLVRPSRYTYSCLEATGDFTVNVPYAELAQHVLTCGTRSGRDMDKFAHCGFSEVTIEKIKSPGIEQCGVIYFCQVVHTNEVLPERLVANIQQSAYPSGDFHRIYWGEIVETLADPDFLERFCAHE